MTDDLPGAIRKFGDKISFVHFRDVKGVPTKYEETWHDAGKTDMLACMKAYRDIGFDGVLRPDHVPTVEGDSNANAGYSSFGRSMRLATSAACTRPSTRTRITFLKIALTGGSGSVGHAIVLEALRQGIASPILTGCRRGSRQPGVPFVQLEMDDYAGW